MTHKRTIWIVLLVVFATTVVLLLWMNRTSVATREALDSARQKWQQAGIKDYNMELETLGAQTGRYSIAVRDGDLVSLTRNGVSADPANGSYWLVEGWFKIIEETLDHKENPASRAFPTDREVWVRMRVNEEYGYPERFIRQITGTSLGMEMRVIKFEVVDK